MPSYYRDPGAPRPNLPRRVGVTALIQRDDAFLVERRADDAHVWAFIGGTLEEDEEVLEALRREVLEETGFAVERTELFGVFSDPTRIVAYPDGNICSVVSIAFRVTPRGDGLPTLSPKSAEMVFVSADELSQLPFWPIHRPIRDAVLRLAKPPVVE
jgi:ADP-ribose pyrophosphatase YjhB (NUDIX family)